MDPTTGHFLSSCVPGRSAPDSLIPRASKQSGRTSRFRRPCAAGVRGGNEGVLGL
jgi:hypothetical protein